MDLHLYKTSSDNKVINKTLLEEKIIQDVIVKDYLQLTTATITLRYDESIMDYNYCYIPAFNRYYFINEIVLDSKDIYTLDLKVDVLKTYKTGILQSSGLVIAGFDQTHHNYINRHTQVQEKTEFEKFESDTLQTVNYESILVNITIKPVTGGN